MTFDPCIICFKHCCQKAIFCKKVPEICPLCHSMISGYVLEPFRLPYPFAKAKECPVTIALRPSHGDFLNDYRVSDDMHIGIVNSEGHIFEFDKPGVVKNDFLNWENCLTLKIVPDSWTDHWDERIEAICNDEKWSERNYNEETLNCFNFVIEFLKELKHKEVEFSNKEEFCRNFILPKMQDALKFITFYRKLKDADHFVSN